MHFAVTGLTSDDCVRTVQNSVDAVEGSPSAEASVTSTADVEKTLSPARRSVSKAEGMKSHGCVSDGVKEDVNGTRVKGEEIVELELEGERLLLGVTWTALKSLLWGERKMDV